MTNCCFKGFVSLFCVFGRMVIHPREGFVISLLFHVYLPFSALFPEHGCSLSRLRFELFLNFAPHSLQRLTFGGYCLCRCSSSNQHARHLLHCLAGLHFDGHFRCRSERRWFENALILAKPAAGIFYNTRGPLAEGCKLMIFVTSKESQAEHCLFF